MIEYSVLIILARTIIVPEWKQSKLTCPVHLLARSPTSLRQAQLITSIQPALLLITSLFNLLHWSPFYSTCSMVHLLTLLNCYSTCSFDHLSIQPAQLITYISTVSMRYPFNLCVHLLTSPFNLYNVFVHIFIQSDAITSPINLSICSPLHSTCNHVLISI